MIRRSYLLAVTLVLLLVMGCSPPATSEAMGDPVIAPRRRAVIAVDVLDDSETPGFTAELYLKVQSSVNRELVVLFPVNVGQYSGQRRVVHDTPFFLLDEHERETLLLELLDEDELTSAEEEKVLKACSSGGALLWIGVQLFCVRFDSPILLNEGQRVTADGVRNVASLVLGNLAQHVFDSYGKADYHVPRQPATEYRSANPITITEGTRSRAEIRIYYEALKEQSPATALNEQPATMNVLLPNAQAQLWINDRPSRQIGTSRTFVSPPLDPGKEYYYTVKASWESSKNTKVTRVKHVRVQAGKETHVDLTKADANTPDEIRASK